MILRQSPRPTPAQLSHHTSLDALYSILGETEGPGVCFRAVSNKYKNDAEELKMGEYMLEKVRSVLSHSMLHQIKGYEDSASISFMEGETTGYMLNEYGNCRLDFDLRTLNRGYFDGHLMDCEYIQKDNLKQFADEYVQRMLNILQEIKNLQQKHGTNSCEAVALLPEFVMMENDIIHKIFTIKEYRWKEEHEWRILVDLKDKDISYTSNGKPYVNCILDKTLLTGIVLFQTEKDTVDLNVEKLKIEKLLSDHGYKACVSISSVV